MGCVCVCLSPCIHILVAYSTQLTRTNMTGKLRKTTYKDRTTELIKLFIQWRGPNKRCIERNEIKKHYIVIAYLQTHFASIETQCTAFSLIRWNYKKNCVVSLNESLLFSCIISNLLSSLFLQLHTSFIENWYLKQRCVFWRVNFMSWMPLRERNCLILYFDQGS